MPPMIDTLLTICLQNRCETPGRFPNDIGEVAFYAAGLLSR